MRAVVSEQVKEFYTEGAQAFDPRYPAVKFRGKVYVATPRHMDAINLAFAGMTQMQKRRFRAAQRQFGGGAHGH